MERFAQKDNVAALLDANLAFHLRLCRLSDNLYLIDHAYRLLTPFFAFVRIRALASGQGASLWAKDLPAFRRIVELIKEGEGETSSSTSGESWSGLQPPPMLIGKKASPLNTAVVSRAHYTEGVFDAVSLSIPSL
jgi:hypothetical protein